VVVYTVAETAAEIEVVKIETTEMAKAASQVAQVVKHLVQAKLVVVLRGETSAIPGAAMEKALSAVTIVALGAQLMAAASVASTTAVTVKRVAKSLVAGVTAVTAARMLNELLQLQVNHAHRAWLDRSLRRLTEQTTNRPFPLL